MVIGGNVLNWIASYLSNRSFKVRVRMSKSKSYVLEIGVPQGSILGPLLFILYTKELQDIVSKYGLSVHLYADDTQIYLAFDVHSKNVDLSQLTNCFNEVRCWMSENCMKLNEEKTEVMDIGMYKSSINEIKLHSEIIKPVSKAKNLGFYFDHTMSLNDQITATQKVCNINLRNLRRIAFTLPHSLKVQLVHSCILFFLDNYNCTYGALSCLNVQKLQTIQNDAVRFIFNIKGKDKWKSITPYLKRLNFLPVKFRIQYKIALMVFKCINNIAPDYLSSIIKFRSPNRYSMRMDNDFYLLEIVPSETKRAKGAFSYQGPRVWNKLPYSIRLLNELSKFKTELKTHYFKLAYRCDGGDI